MKRQIQRAEVAQDPKLVIRGAGILTPVHVFFNNYVQLKHRSKLNVILNWHHLRYYILGGLELKLVLSPALLLTALGIT